VRAEGLVTMRRLAQALGTGPAALYVYVLLAAVLDELLGEVDLGSDSGDWRDRLVRVLISYTTVLYEHPGARPVRLVARPVGARYLDLLEALLSLLDQGGVPADRAAWVVDLLQFATATAAEHATREWAISGQDQQDALVAGCFSWDASAPGRARRRTAVRPARSRLTWGCHMLINGALATPVHMSNSK
jgi:hypothetical protein